MKNVSLKDIATKAGASISSVSLVLNGKDKKGRISATLAKKIKAIAKEEGYVPNKMAVGLRTGRSNIIGLIVDTINGHFFASLAEVIETEVDKYGYKVIYCSTGNDTKKGKDMIRMLYQYQVDGYFIIPAPGMEKELQSLQDQGKPTVLIDSYFPSIPSAHVLVDNYEGISTAVDHLLKKGYKRVAFVYNDVSMVQMKMRKQGYIETLQKAGIKPSAEWMLKVPVGARREEQAAQIEKFLKKTKPDSVLFAANYLGIMGIEAIRNLKLRIREDIGVVCFDDHELFNLFQPGITVVQQPVKELAQKAVSILMAKMGVQPAKGKEQVEIKGKLIQRQST